MSTLQNWNKIKLKEICNFLNGDAYKDTDWSNTGVPIVRIQNLNDSSKPFNYWAGTTENRITIDNNDLLLAWSGTPGTSFGAHIWNRGFALLNQHIFKVIYDQKSANPLWLKYAINQILKIMIDKSHGAVGLRHVTKPEVENLEIILPPREEQERIVKIIEEKLTATEKAKIASVEQKILIDKLATSVIQNIFNNKEWEKNSLGNICEFVYGDSLPKQNRVKGNIPVYGSNGQIDLHNKYLTEGKTIIVGRKGSIGEVHISEGDCWVIDTAYYVKPLIEINIQYLYFLLKALKLSKLNKASSIPGLNRDDVYKIDINLPPLEEQERIVKIIKTKLTAIEKTKNVVDELFSYINALPSSILRKAFNGDY